MTELLELLTDLEHFLIAVSRPLARSSDEVHLDSCPRAQLDGAPGIGKPARQLTSTADHGRYAPAGGVISTITDMSRLAAGLLTSSAPGMTAVNAIESGHSPVRGRQHGMFWIIDAQAETGQRRIWHNGATGGYSSFLALAPETGRGVIVLSGASRPSQTARIAADLAARPTEAD